MTKPKRNEPCPCGSGKKYKKCCFSHNRAAVTNLSWQKMRRTEGMLIPTLLEYAAHHYSPEAVLEAWCEFTFSDEIPMDAQEYPELDTTFMPWFVFNWLPNNEGVDVAEHYPEMPIALHYLASQNNVDSYQRRFIEEICAQPFSFFMVESFDPGQSLTLRDLLLQQVITVHERQASTSLDKGSIVFSRIITLDDQSIMVGCAPTVIPPQYLHDLIDLHADLEKNLSPLNQHVLQSCDMLLRSLYFSIREELHNPSLPELHNTDGELVQPTKLYYQLNCSPEQALKALATLALIKQAHELSPHGQYNKNGELTSITFDWLKKGNQHHAEWSNTVMGNICIQENKLTIDVNSEQRAEVIKRKIKRRLGKHAVFKNAVIQSSKKMMEDLANQSQDTAPFSNEHDDDDLQNHPEVQAQLKHMSEQHWATWLDTELPVLDNQTPRDAAKNNLGRKHLEALLLEFEQHAQIPQAFTPDIDALRLSLGLD